MGVINITPDSFYSKSRFAGQAAILREAEKMLDEGAFAVDIGGYSSRPGAVDISEEEEIERVIPAIEAVSRTFPGCVISVDTFRYSVAERAVEAGASIVNDISGGELDGNMFDRVGELKVPYILMHMKGDPGNMKLLADYNNLFKEIAVYFNKKIQQLTSRGIIDIILDPGFGFSKTIAHNYELLKNFSYFTMLGYPLMAGLSRKSMVYRTLECGPEEALNGTTVINTIALLKKASILRVHDVKEAVATIKILKQFEH